MYPDLDHQRLAPDAASTNRQTTIRVVTVVYANGDEYIRIAFPSIKISSVPIIDPDQDYTHRVTISPIPFSIPRLFPVIPGRR